MPPSPGAHMPSANAYPLWCQPTCATQRAPARALARWRLRQNKRGLCGGRGIMVHAHACPVPRVGMRMVWAWKIARRLHQGRHCAIPDESRGCRRGRGWWPHSVACWFAFGGIFTPAQFVMRFDLNFRPHAHTFRPMEHFAPHAVQVFFGIGIATVLHAGGAM